jgi:hypothetical protein
MPLGKFGCTSTRERGPKQEDHVAMNAHILDNPYVWQKDNEASAFEWARKKVLEEFDTLQSEAK